jgi:hypothetical protein
MWYKIYQQKRPKPEKNLVRRPILLELDRETHALATKLKLEITIEIGDTLAAVIGIMGDTEITTMAKVTIPGLDFASGDLAAPGLDYGENHLPTIQEACVTLVRIANEPEGSTLRSNNLYRRRSRTESGTGGLGGDPSARRRERK